MKLFEVVPESFFRLLSGTNKQLNAEAVQLLYEHAKRERFGIRIELMRDLYQELIESWEALGAQLDWEEEQLSDQAAPGQVIMEEVSRAKANSLIRRLESLGWIELETRDRYEVYIVLPHYTIRMLSLIQELCEGRAIEYQRYAFATYGMLSGEEARERPAMAVREALSHTIQFDRELFTLYNNMKHHMEQVVSKKSIQEVLDHHFDHYQKNIVENSYHRLKTSDHVARYRHQILDIVQRWQLDSVWMEQAVQDGLAGGLYTNAEEAETHLRQSLRDIEAIYLGLDDTFYRIDLRHNQYLRSSYDRARYLSQHHQGLDRKLASILETLGHSSFPPIQEKDLIPLSRLQHIQVLNEGSLLPVRRKRLPHQPEEHLVLPIPDEVREQLRSERIERLRKAVTRKKVDDFVLLRLQNKDHIEIAELAPRDVEEVLLLTYVYLYGQDGGSPYRIERNQERVILHAGPYRFCNHIIRPRISRGRQHV
ncbi:Wadjet anti-phage system protein JetA family protein [Paenibacillus sp. YN15]|uniref:Wadjet anti-phage system protein JetA family protein n=1 Tax=Paenibacillus sp. YN15 TaxID=1742774 RepID=UPI000DCB428B|nr:Wadjet anti-phage system protein JetA family protein [Paenibacillus sp. YN15]RAU92173.1 hypothetical protein DQG13_28060 [Paenibacillus sp. YN15]